MKRKGVGALADLHLASWAWGRADLSLLSLLEIKLTSHGRKASYCECMRPQVIHGPMGVCKAVQTNRNRKPRTPGVQLVNDLLQALHHIFCLQRRCLHCLSNEKEQESTGSETSFIWELWANPPWRDSWYQESA